MHETNRWVELGLSRAALALVGGWLLVTSPAVGQPAPAAPAADAAQSAKSWLGNEAELEAYLKTVEPVKLEPIGTGVTNPHKATLPPGGPAEAFAWKPIRPGLYKGFYESYKTEVAAYELDKLLGLGMVPVTVERRINRELGAACLWVTPTRSFKDLGGPPRPPASERHRWYLQLARAKMFDNLMYNKDPNLGNWLKDPAWNLILIDHSRSFGAGQTMAHKLQRVDEELWQRMLALSEESLTAALGEWLNKKQIRSILKRRDRMKDVIAELIAEKGSGAVMVRTRQ